jgi:hypothetical protein
LGNPASGHHVQERSETVDSLELLKYATKDAFEILRDVTKDLTQAQADWQPPGCANPIGATYWHLLSSCDEIVNRWGREQVPLAERDGWRGRALTIDPAEPEHGGDWYGWMCTARVDLPGLHEYAEAVAGAIQDWLASLEPEDLGHTIKTPLGELSLDQIVTTFVLWHVNAHCGEIAALKGCQGARGYTF